MNQKSKLTFGKIFERFSYGCGDFGCNIIYTAMSAFLLFYYTDYANVSAMAVGTIMMISRIFDGVSDIIMGVIVDRTRSKYGKARTYVYSLCSVRNPSVFCSCILGFHAETCICIHYIQPCFHSDLYSHQRAVFRTERTDDTGSL